ncbi:MAG: aldehyde dehydrogenase [Acidimicrobiia bacterium BACL6 MAG-120910-bin40]|jgi:aldehyde dehydrogenase (NAD+)|nr:MAG: aldehyde dehydrogenase [Acidimicrobiia bacterium BACL6 MAG-120910-bin40]
MISQVVAKTRSAYESGKTRPLAWRKTQLQACVRMLQENADQFAEALATDLGRGPEEAWLYDIGFSITEIELMIKNLKKWTEPRKVSTPMVSLPGSSHRVPQPLGVVLVIAPWNYPIQLLLIPVAGAIAAGNAVVMKPSEVSSATSALLGKLVPRYLDNDAITIVEGAVSETTQLLAEKFDHIFYTGNGTVGRIVMRAAAENLTPVTLELGGKSPTIVDKSANLAIAGRRIAWAKYVNAGQTCVAPDYVLAHDSIADKLVEEIRKSIKNFYGDDPRQSSDFARISSPRHFSRLDAMLASGNIAIGGQTDEQDRYISPTVLVDVKASDAVMQEEIFGPILPVLAVQSIDDAIDFVNARPHPLALYVFAEDQKVNDKVVASTTSGGVTVNGTIFHMTGPFLPFGGVGESGMGAYHGRAGVDTFQHLKPVLKRSTRVDAPLAYPPYTKRKFAILKKFI